MRSFRAASALSLTGSSLGNSDAAFFKTSLKVQTCIMIDEWESTVCCQCSVFSFHQVLGTTRENLQNWGQITCQIPNGTWRPWILHDWGNLLTNIAIQNNMRLWTNLDPTSSLEIKDWTNLWWRAISCSHFDQPSCLLVIFKGGTLRWSCHDRHQFNSLSTPRAFSLNKTSL